MKNNIIGRKVTLNPKYEWSPMYKEEWTAFMGTDPGVIEAVHRDNQSQMDNPYYVLVRNSKGESREFALVHLLLEE